MDGEGAQQVPSGGPLQLRVKTLAPATYEIDLAPDATVGALKAELETRSGVPAEQQRLLFCGRVLANDAATLASCGARNGHTLHMVERPPDVPPQPQNNAPPVAQPPGAAGGPSRVGVQRIAFSTVNTAGGTNGAGDAPGNFDRIISTLLSAVGVPLPPAGATPTNANPGAGDAAQPGVQFAGQFEINIENVPPGQRNDGQPDRHPFEVLDGFLRNVRSIIEASRGPDGVAGRRDPIVSRESEASGSPIPDTRHFDVECDICGTCPIQGPRYKSLSNSNYDLCDRCVRTERASAHEPYVQIDVPISSQIEQVLNSLRSNPQQQNDMLRSAAEAVIGAHTLRSAAATETAESQTRLQEEGGGQGGLGAEAAQENADPSAVMLDRLAILALSSLAEDVCSLLEGDASTYIRQRVAAISMDLGRRDLNEAAQRYAVQGNMLHLSSMMNAFGALLLEVGRLLGGLHINSPDNRRAASEPEASRGPLLRSFNRGYVHQNASQVAIPSPTQSDRPGFFLGLPNVVQTSFPGAPQPQTGGPTPAPRTSGGTVPSGGSGGVQASSAGAPPASQAPPSGDARPEAAPQNAYQRLPVRLPPPARVDGQEMQSHARDNNPHIPAPLRTPLPPSASPRDALVRAHDPLRPSLQPQPEPQPAPTPAPTPPPQSPPPERDAPGTVGAVESFPISAGPAERLGGSDAAHTEAEIRPETQAQADVAQAGSAGSPAPMDKGKETRGEGAAGSAGAGPSSSGGVRGLGLGLKPRRRKVAEGTPAEAAARAAGVAGVGAGLPSRSAPPASERSRSSGPPNILEQMMPMMSRLLAADGPRGAGGAGDGVRAGEARTAARTGAPDLDAALSVLEDDEERMRWKRVIEADAQTQEDAAAGARRFSPAYRSLNGSVLYEDAKEGGA